MRQKPDPHFAVDDATPDVRGGEIFRINSGDTAGHDITDFESSEIGQIITILGSAAASTDVVHNTNFINLVGTTNWTAAAEASLVIKSSIF